MFIQKMKYGFLLVLACMFCGSSEAQVLDSLRHYYNQEPHVFGAFNNRTSIVDGNNAKLLGIQGGLVFGERHRLYMAYSWMGAPVTELKIANAHTVLADTTINSLTMGFLSFGQDYVWHQTSKWKFALPIQLGIGTTTLKKFDTDNELLNSKTHVVIPLEIGVTATYYITDWLTINGGLGNRFALSNSEASQLSGPYYKLGVGVLFGVIYKKITGKD